MRRLVVLSLLASAALAAPAGAGPGRLPVGTAGTGTPNVRGLSNSPVGSGVSGAFLDKSTYVLSVADAVWNASSLPVTATGGLVVYDTSVPEEPSIVGLLPIPNYQNEDIAVSSERRMAVLSQDAGIGVPGRLYLVDLSDPAMPSAGAVLSLPGGYGHTSTLVDHDRYLWVSGGTDVLVVDVRDLTAPAVVGTFETPAGAEGPGGDLGVHDVSVDRFGDISVYGSGGTAVHRLGSDPLKPSLVARTVGMTKRLNGLIHHGGVRLDRDTWAITEEDYSSSCDDDGSLQVWKLDRKAKALRNVSSYDVPTGSDDDRGPLTQGQYCSSHWFDVNGAKVVADAWYGAGVRFLDLSNPRRPRPVGTWVGDSATAGEAEFFPGRDDLVYVADYVRGLDVVRIDKGGKGAKTVSPADERPVEGSPAPGLGFRVRLTPDRTWGFACLRPEAGHHPSAQASGGRSPIRGMSTLARL